MSVGSRSIEVPVGSACWDMVSVGSVHVYGIRWESFYHGGTRLGVLVGRRTTLML